MERVKAEVIQVLQALLGPKALVLRNDSPSRALEGLPSYVDTIGSAPEQVEIEENGVRFEVPLLSGQKTGWFYDQRLNRARMLDYVRGRRVLDGFSYIGAWGVQAAAAGADEVVCLDSSAGALERLQRNAALNGVKSRITAMQGDALEALKELSGQFGTVILDPPAFIKRKKDVVQGEQAYWRLNELGMRCLRGDGTLITSSCSYHLSAERLQGILLRASRNAERRLQLLEQGGQGPDHPVHPAIPETRYLKVYFVHVLA
jgi:23S rRNA (cytosine1962-C5)-methyltransferase